MGNGHYIEVKEPLGKEPHNGISKGMSPVIRDVIKSKVISFLEEKRAYLDPTMSLLKFSSITSTNTTYLSRTVNECFGCGFRTLINKYRVEHAIERMKVEGAVTASLYKGCGFTSRSVFYSSFKQITGMTPLQLLKQITSDNGHFGRKMKETEGESGKKPTHHRPTGNSKYNKNKSYGLIDYKDRAILD